MNLKDLLQLVKLEKIEKQIVNYYPHEIDKVQAGDYAKLFDELSTLEPLDNDLTRMLHVEYITECGNANEHIWNVSYSQDKRYDRKYTLDFLSKAEILGSMISELDMDKLDNDSYVSLVFQGMLSEEDTVEEPDLENGSKRGSRKYLSLEEVLSSSDEGEFD